MGYGGGGGAASFLDLLDTPATYAGQSLKLVKVNVGETALSLDLLLSFTDWYAGALPTDYPWVFEANNPQDSAIIQCSAIIKNSIGQYIVYVTFYVASPSFYRYNLTTKQWHRLANPSTNLNSPISISPDGKKLAATAGMDTVEIYDIEANTWETSPTAPQISTEDVQVKSSVWADDNDTLWCVVRANVPPQTVKCFRYVVSTTTWTQFANSLTPVTYLAHAMGITPDQTALYFGGCGADDNDASKYVISTDTYTTPITLGGSYHFAYCSDRNKLWYGADTDSKWELSRYIDLSDESLHLIFPTNPQRNKPSNIMAGVFETSIAFVGYRITEPKNMSYSGTGYWKLGQRILTDYNLVVFKKPADGYAILAIDKVNNHTVPIYLFSTLVLPAGTWEFFYPKDGDYTKLKISGSVLK
ncbi:hypothetical protein ES705_38788 [subsurface metagenome]